MSQSAWIPGRPKAKDRPRIGNGHAYTPSKTTEYERRVAEATEHIRVGGDAVCLTVTFYFGIPKSWSKSKREKAHGMPHTSVPDIDNILKSVMDGMSQCWQDDRQVYSVVGMKIYGTMEGTMVEVETFNEFLKRMGEQV